MGSFIMRCSETKSVLPEGASAIIVFHAQTFKSSIPNGAILQGSPKPVFATKCKAKDYGEFAVNEKDLERFTNFFKTVNVLNATHQSARVQNWFNTINKSSAELKELYYKDKPLHIDFSTIKIDENSDVRDYSAHILVEALKRGICTNKQFLFDGVLHDSYSNAIFVKVGQEIYRLTASVYSETVIKKTKNLSLWDHNLQKVNLEQYTDNLLKEAFNRHKEPKFDIVTKAMLSDNLGTNFTYIDGANTGGNINDYLASIKTTNYSIAQNKIRKSMKDFFLYSFLFEAGLSTEPIIYGGQDYKNTEAKKMHNIIVQSLNQGA